MALIIKLILYFLLLSLFFYSKVQVHKAVLAPNILRYYNFVDRIWTPVLTFSRKLIKPAVIGKGVAIDVSQFVIFILLITILTALR